MKKQLIWILIGSIVLLYALFQFGLWALTNISGFFIGLNERNSSQATSEKTSSLLTAPILDSLTDATSSATIDINGRTSDQDGTIQVFINDRKVKDLDIDKDSTFKGRVTGLSAGDNTVKARFVAASGEKSDFSKEQTITYSKDAPKIDDLSPADNSEFRREEDRIEIRGKTSPNSKVFVNDFIAIVSEDGKFSYMLKLSEGDNLIKIKAENDAGLSTEKTIRVIYRP